MTSRQTLKFNMMICLCIPTSYGWRWYLLYSMLWFIKPVRFWWTTNLKIQFICWIWKRKANDNEKQRNRKAGHIRIDEVSPFFFFVYILNSCSPLPLPFCPLSFASLSSQSNSSETRQLKLFKLENLYIAMVENTCNIQKGRDLNPIWLPLLRHFS